jgi:hypothetical protein
MTNTTEILRPIFERYGFNFKRYDRYDTPQPEPLEAGCYEVYWPGMESPDALIRDGNEKHDWNRLVENMVADAAAYYKVLRLHPEYLACDLDSLLTAKQN